MSRVRPGRRLGLVTLVYTALGLLLMWPLPLHLFAAIPGDGFDGWQNYWNLWWVRRALLELGTSPWYTTMLDYPAGASLLFHTLNAPNGVLSLPVQESLGLVPAYNSIVLMSFGLGGLGTYLLALRVLRRRDPLARATAFIAGMIFALSPFHLAHLLGHMQVFAFQWLPFYCLVLLGLLEQATRHDGIQSRSVLAKLAVASLFLVLAALTDWYNLLYLGLLTILWIVWYSWRAHSQGRQVVARYWLMGVILAGASFIPLSPLLVPMVQEARRADYMVPDQRELLFWSQDLLAFALPQEMHPLWGKWAGRFAGRFRASTSERMVSLGFTPLILSLVAWWRGGERSRPFVWMGLGFAALALGPVLRIGGKVVAVGGQVVTLPYLLLYNVVPFMGIARSVGRFSIMVVLAVAVLAGMGLLYLSRQFIRFPLMVPVLAGLLVCIEYLPVPYQISVPDTPAWYRLLGQERGNSAVLNLPGNWDRPQYLLYQTVHGRPLAMGYISRHNPWAVADRYPGLQQLHSLGEDVLPFPDAATFATIAEDLGIEYVVFDYYQMPGGEERELTVALGEQLLAGQEVIYQDGRLTVYKLALPAQRQPYVYLLGPWGAPRPDANGGGREVCADCALVLVAPSTCRARLDVSCEHSGTVSATIQGGSSVLARELFPECSILRRIDWSLECGQ
ncbi:MAG: hypothetical protein ACUVWR_03160 [Anaerolineae bacterium]